MSIRATVWAWTVPTSPTGKLVLLALADHADEVGHCWPGIGRLVEMTGLSERAVRNQLRTLEAEGRIRTERAVGRGHTSRYALGINLPPGKGQDVPVFGREEKGHVVPEKGHLVPQKGHVVPEKGHQMPPNHQEPSGTVSEPSKEARRAPVMVELPAWLPADAWADWCAYRTRTKKDRAAWTQKAADLTIRELGRLHGQGQDPRALIEQAIMRGWQGIYPLKNHHAAPAAPARKPSNLDWMIQDGLVPGVAPADTAFDLDGFAEEITP